jgi:hypothetical protein
MLICMSSDEIVAKLSEVLDRVIRCESALKIGFNYLMVMAERAAAEYYLKKAKGESSRRKNASMDSKEAEIDSMEVIEEEGEIVDVNMPPKEIPSTTYEQAARRLTEIFAEYIDQHKDNAFKSSILELAKACFATIGDQGHLDHVDVHGLNWYAILLIKILGVQLPVVPLLEDGCLLGVCDVWLADEMGKIWPEIAKSEFFGAEYSKLQRLRARRNCSLIEMLASISPRYSPEQFASNLDNANANAREKAAIYSERFAHFFTEGFFLPKMFSVLYKSSRADPSF